ncbi:MAG: hypothetical protein ISR65_09285 [Bacteriovoracaceae bacterium]|nr:hypothetical protein [Bacteriovoracaceae bacterium]
MKKLLLFTLTTLFLTSSFAFANTVEEADELLSRRGEGVELAAQAADIYEALAQQETDVLKKADLYISMSDAVYFVGTRTADEPQEAKLAVFQRGMDAAKEAFALLELEPGVAKLEEYKTPLSRANYFFSANLGKWGETKGILVSLGQWPTLKKHLNYMIALDETVESYGVYRVLGRAYMKIPFESNQQGLDYMKKAYDNTLVTVSDITLSKNSTTVVYYLDLLMKLGNDDETFCEVFESFSDLVDGGEELLQLYAPDRLPETKKDVNDFVGNDTVLEYFDENC